MSIIIKKLNNKLIAVTVGDIEGIGISLLIKEWLRKKVNNFILITNIEIFKKSFKLSKNRINLIKKRSNIYSKALYKINCDGLSKSEVVKKVIALYENKKNNN